MLNFNESTTVAEYDIEYRMTSLNTSGDVDSLFDFLVANFTESMNTEKIDGEKVDAAFAEEHSGYLQSTTSKRHDKISRRQSSQTNQGKQTRVIDP